MTLFTLPRFYTHALVTLFTLPRFYTHALVTLFTVPRFYTHALVSLFTVPRFYTHALVSNLLIFTPSLRQLEFQPCFRDGKTERSRKLPKMTQQ